MAKWTNGKRTRHITKGLLIAVPTRDPKIATHCPCTCPTYNKSRLVLACCDRVSSFQRSASARWFVIAEAAPNDGIWGIGVRRYVLPTTRHSILYGKTHRTQKYVLVVARAFAGLVLRASLVPFTCPTANRGWFWHAATGSVLLQDGWQQYLDGDTQKYWWWHEPSQDWFYEGQHCFFFLLASGKGETYIKALADCRVNVVIWAPFRALICKGRVSEAWN